MGTRNDRGFRFPLQKYSDEKALYTNFRYLQEYLNYIRRKDKFTATYDIARAGTDAEARAAYIADGTNDHVQIQAALDALPSDGGHIYIHEGTYDIRSRVTFPAKPVIMSGPGKISFNLNDTGFMGGDAHHVLFGLSFTGRTGSSGGTHKYSIDGSHWDITNCFFNNMDASIVVGGRDFIKRLNVVGCRFENIRIYNDGRASPDLGVIGTGDGGTTEAQGAVIGNYFRDIDFTGVTSLGSNHFLVNGDNDNMLAIVGNAAEDLTDISSSSCYQGNASHNIVNGTMIAGTHSGVDHGSLTGLTDNDHTQYVLRSILTTQGDLFTRDGSAIKRLAIGTEGQFLKAGASEPEWADVETDPFADILMLGGM